jgi:hypothetical protein
MKRAAAQKKAPPFCPSGVEGLLVLFQFGVLVMLLASCGYRFTAPNSSLPGGITAAHVPFFTNRTAEPGAEIPFTQAARDQLDRAGRLGGPDSDAVLEGTIIAVGSGPFMTAPTLPRQPGFRMSATISLTLKKNGVDVGTTTVAVSEEFPSGADVLLTESNRAAALRRLADATVREGFERLQSPR